jgi:PD-(D/E)XK nuclease superfamily
MNYPVLYFVNEEGRKLSEENDYQYCIEYEEKLYLQTDADWDGKVGLIDEEGSKIFELETVQSLPKRWKLQLEDEDRKYATNKEIKETEKEEKRLKQISGRVGWTTAVLLDTNCELIPEAPQARLQIKPGNLTEEKLREIVAEIGLLALEVGSFFSYSSSSYQSEQAGAELGQDIDPTGSLLTAPQLLLDLYNLTRNLWTEIEKRPLKSFRNEITPVDITKNFNSPQVLISRKMGLGKKRILSMSSVESLDCSENQFLCYVLDVYLKDTVSGLIKLIEEFDLRPLPNNGSSSYISQINKFSQNNGNSVEVSEFFQKAKKARDNFERVSRFSKEKREKISEQLKECLKWAKDIRSTSFLKDIVTPNSPSLNSQRLIKSPTYGLILKAYNKCDGSSHSSGIAQVIRLYRKTLSLQVKATWEIYEIWCFIKIYSVLATQFRLTPPIGARSLFDSIPLISKENSISIPKEEEFKLQGKLVNETELNVSLWYDTKQYWYDSTQDRRELRPDIKLKIVINGKENIYYFDAKYKKYKTQGIKEFFEDAFCVAKCKYLDRLKPKASFVLHPDSEFDFWGEVPLEIFVKDKFNSDVQSKVSNTCTLKPLLKPSKKLKDPCNLCGERSLPVGHEYGAIALTPGNKASTQINKLMKLLFQYHGDLLTTCLNCGCEAITELSWTVLDWNKQQKQESKEKIIRGTSNSKAALYCSCQQCGDFWVRQRCQGSNHKLLKFSDSFHKRSSKYSTSWIYLCPECENDPDFSQ